MVPNALLYSSDSNIQSLTHHLSDITEIWLGSILHLSWNTTDFKAVKKPMLHHKFQSFG